MNVNTQSAQQAYTGHEVTEDSPNTAIGQTSFNGGLSRASEFQSPESWNRYNWNEYVQLDSTEVASPIEQPGSDTTSEDRTDAIHHTTVEWHTVYQELSDLRAQLDRLPGAAVINQEGAVDCIAQIAGGDIVTITEYFNEHNLNLTMNQWNDFSPAVESIRAELSRAQDAQILPGAIAQQTQTRLDFALGQAHDLPNNTAAIQTALNEARQSLESYATQVVDNIKEEFAAANQKMRDPAYYEEIPAHTRRARGWLGIFVGIAKLILAIEFVSKLVPLLALL